MVCRYKNLALFIAIAALANANAQDAPCVQVPGPWVLDTAAQDAQFRREIDRLVRLYPERIEEFRKALKKNSGRLYSELVILPNGTFSWSIGSIGELAESVSGTWQCDDSRVLLIWGGFRKMSLAYQNSNLIYFDDGAPHEPGDGAVSTTLRRISEHEFRIRNNVFSLLIKRFGIERIVTVFVVVISLILGALIFINHLEKLRRRGSKVND